MTSYAQIIWATPTDSSTCERTPREVRVVQKIARNALLILISLLVSLTIAEVFLRAFVPVRNVGVSFTAYDPLYGKSLKKNLNATRTTPEFTMELSTNSLGFRGPEPEGFPHDAILFLGDSFTLGYGVSDGEEYPALIRRAVAEKWGSDAPPIINAGVGDSGNGRWIKFLRSEAAAYHPRLVVLQLFANDFGDNVREGLFSLSHDSELIELPVPARSLTRTVQESIEAIPGLADSYLIGVARQAMSSMRSRQLQASSETSPASTPSSNDQLTYALLEESIHLCKERHWPVIALVIGIEGERLAEIERRLAGADISSIRFPSKPERPDLYYEVDGHWNTHGQALAAEMLLKEVESQGFDKPL
jgi:lysophospholipase L1-like esterase